MLNIYGIFAHAGMPVMQLLESGISNKEHINHIELARECFHRAAREGRRYDAVMVIVGTSEASVFTFK